MNKFSTFSALVTVIAATLSTACGLQVADEEQAPCNVTVNCGDDCSGNEGGSAPVAPATGGEQNVEPATGGSAGSEPVATGGSAGAVVEPDPCEENPCADGCPATDECQVTEECLGYPNLAAPIVVTADGKVSVAEKYIELTSVTSVELVGTLPGLTWDAGLAMSKTADGRWEASIPTGIPAGVYRLQYRSGNAWGMFGADQDRVACYEESWQEWLLCNTTVEAGEFKLNGCDLGVEINTDATGRQVILPAGNPEAWVDRI